MSELFNTILYQPLFNGLVFLYKYVAFEDLGIAIILLTVVIRTLLYPFFYKSFKNQTLMQRIQPHIKKIQHDHKDNREKQAQALMALYKEHKVNPFSGFVLILLQLPILITLYKLFLGGFTAEAMSNLYDFIAAPQEIYHSFLGLIDLQTRSILIVSLAAIAQYFQGRLALPKTAGDPQDPAAKVARSMVFVGPVLTVVLLFSLPSAVGLYWLVTSLFSIGQQLIINKQLNGTNQITSPKTP
ncbi:MAG: YidC/Oxa1 family membrane protein insertase [Patescibacteria group bacterium]